MDKFDRVVFESIVEKVIVGETNDDGTVDPFKLTFVMKGNGNSVVPNAKEWFKAEKKHNKDSIDYFETEKVVTIRNIIKK